MTARVAVIGAGVIGSTIAATLSRRGFDVSVVDSSSPGAQVSAASFAWVNANLAKQPDSYYHLNADAVATQHRWARAGLAPWFHPSGCLEIARTPEELTAREADVSAYRARGAPSDLLRREDVRTRYPQLSDSILGAAELGADGWADTHHLVDHQLQVVRSNGGDVRTHCGVVGIQAARPGSAAAVRFEDGSQPQFDTIVVAAGNGSGTLLHELTGRSLLDTQTAELPTVGLTIETLPLTVRLNTVIRADDVSIRPTSTGGAIIADRATAANYRRDDPRIWELPAALIQRAARLVPGLGAAEIARVRVSERVLPVDGLTIAGFVAQGIYTVLTHSGVTLAPQLSEYTAEELSGSSVTALDSYRPTRFLGD